MITTLNEKKLNKNYDRLVFYTYFLNMMKKTLIILAILVLLLAQKDPNPLDRRNHKVGGLQSIDLNNRGDSEDQ